MDVESTPTTAIHEVIELEEGEILETPENRRSTEPKLKYEYKEDMWSPLNPSGKKQYDRDFLIQLQFDDLSQIKPEQLPDMDIIKACDYIWIINTIPNFAMNMNLIQTKL